MQEVQFQYIFPFKEFHLFLMKLTLIYDKLNAHRSRCNTFEPPHDKTNKMACVLSEDSDQTRWGRVFAVRMKKAWVLSYP